MNQSDFKSAQRSYDNLLPEPEGKFTCKQCGERLWESDMSRATNTCLWCAGENLLKEFEKDLDQYKMKEHK